MISVLRVVSESAEWEEGPKPEMPEFDLRAGLQIAGQQALRDVRRSRSASDSLFDSREHACVGLCQFLTEEAEIGIKIGPDRDGTGLTEVMFKDGFRDPEVGAAGVVEPMQSVVYAKFGFKRADQSSFAGSTGVDECGIDIPEQKFFHRAGTFFRATLSCEHKMNTQTMAMKTLPWWLLLLAVFAGLLGGCSTPAYRIRENPESFAKLAPADQQLIREGKVAVGFTPEMVKLALGNPDRTFTRTDASGTSELWSYATYETESGVVLYRGLYHRYWCDPLYYPYYANYSGRRTHEYLRVVFTAGKVSAIEREN